MMLCMEALYVVEFQANVQFPQSLKNTSIRCFIVLRFTVLHRYYRVFLFFTN